jgi:hypothetical protein
VNVTTVAVSAKEVTLRTNKYVGPLSLPTELYKHLEQRGRAEERDPLQQARWLLRQVLTAPEAQDTREPALTDAINADGPRAT